MEYIETGIKNAFGMTFRVHTHNLFKELWECSGMKIYGKVMRIFLALLNDVAQRATEINDPVMNALMLKHTGFVEDFTWLKIFYNEVDLSDIAVIGNIHDNPELLKKEL